MPGAEDEAEAWAGVADGAEAGATTGATINTTIRAETCVCIAGPEGTVGSGGI